MLKNILAFPKSVRSFLLKTNDPIKVAQVHDNNTPTVLFATVVLLYVVFQIALQPSWVFSGEMYAEMATNYFPNANSPSYYQKLFATDAGYIPFPQRLIALIGNLFNLPVSSIPYLYTWSAIILTGVMIGVFCLAPFRSLVENDVLRFLTAIAILLVVDFDTRTFLNFTYFSAFTITIVTALAFVEDSNEVPFWAWVIPILSVSKPAVLAVLPTMIFVAIISKSRFRWITVASIVLCIGQALQLIVSNMSGTAPFKNDQFTFIEKIISTFEYFFGILGGYLFGHFQSNAYFSMLAGLFVLIVSGIVIYRIRSRASILILLGFSLLFFNVFLNSFAISEYWNIGMAQLSGFPISRHITVGYFGSILVALGLVVSITENKFTKSKKMLARNFGAVVFLLWFIGSGLFLTGTQVSREPRWPTINNSQWQNMSLAIDSGVFSICVPIDPFGWVYSRNCGYLITMPWSVLNYFDSVPLVDDIIMFEVTPSALLSGKTLVSLAVFAKPLTMQTKLISVRAIIRLKNGNKKYFSGDRNLPISGGLILMTGKNNFKIDNIASVKFVFSSPIEVAVQENEQDNTSSILWMGY